MQIDNLNSPVNKNPLGTYKYLLLGPMMSVYSIREKKQDWERHANLLIDKFAIHSSTLFHVMQGMVEHKSSTQDQIKMGYDLFSINALIRTLIETYITFHHIFVSPEDKDEMKLRFMLWQLDGLLEKRKFEISPSILSEVETILKQDEKRIKNICDEIEQNSVYLKMAKAEQLKIYECTSTRIKVIWKFNISIDLKIHQLKIIELVRQVCCTEAFVNTYKYSSIHTHSGYLSIEHFDKMRGKVVSNEYTDPLIRLAIYLTTFMIRDMSDTDKASKDGFSRLSAGVQNFINGIADSFRAKSPN